MKLILSAQGPGLDSHFEEHFGRCSWFILFDSESGEVESFPNPAANSTSGAGAQASQFITNKGAQAVISGRFGPHAFRALSSAGTEMYYADENLVKEVLEKFAAGLLDHVGTPDKPGSRGSHRHRERNGL